MGRGRLKPTPEYYFNDYIDQYKSHVDVSTNIRLIDEDLINFCNYFLAFPPRFENLYIEPNVIATFRMVDIWETAQIDFSDLSNLWGVNSGWIETQFNKAIKLDFIYPNGTVHPLLNEILKSKSKLQLEKLLGLN